MGDLLTKPQASGVRIGAVQGSRPTNIMNAHTVSHSLLEAETVFLSLEDKELICLVHLQVFAFVRKMSSAMTVL